MRFLIVVRKKKEIGVNGIFQRGKSPAVHHRRWMKMGPTTGGFQCKLNSPSSKKMARPSGNNHQDHAFCHVMHYVSKSTPKKINCQFKRAQQINSHYTFLLWLFIILLICDALKCLVLFKWRGIIQLSNFKWFGNIK